MRCVLNEEVVELPEDLLLNEAVFKSVVNMQTWNNELTAEEKDHLLQFIPKPLNEEDLNFQDEAIMMALSTDKKLKHGNPVQNMYQQLKEGHLSPKVLKMKKRFQKLKWKNYKLSQKEYYKNLLQEILVSRKVMFEKSYKNGVGYTYKNRKEHLLFTNPVCNRVRRKYDKILKDVSTECGDDGSSSDEEDFHGDLKATTSRYKLPAKMQADSPTPLSSSFNSPLETVSVDDFNHMMAVHRDRRYHNQSHPEIDTTNISLADVIMRCNSLKKTVTGKAKVKKFKKDLDFPKMNSAKVEKNRKSNLEDSNDTQVNKPQKRLDATRKSSTCHGYPRMGSFFSLLGYFFEQEREKKCNMSKLEEKLASWQTHNSSESCGWKTLYPSWLPLLKYAVDYMSGSGTASLLNDFIPLLVPGEEQEWTWTGPEHDNDEVIMPLCNHWLETFGQSMSDDKTDDVDRQTIDTTRTSYVVQSSSAEEKEHFRKQEKDRYNAPHKPFIYNTHGYESIVGPVKGVFSGKDLSSSKAREHAMLVSERPAYVTILCLVRDAVARLPNGEGTRAEVCVLLKDSQFLNPQATDAQIHSVVSGALDRLHSEKDPCVKFDAPRKLWIYLHRTRSVEEFEKIHEASAAAALAKKQMTQSKQKVAKQKKLSAEFGDIAEKVKPRKDSTPKVKKSDASMIPPTSSSGPTIMDGDTTSKKEDVMKKVVKRKRSVNENLPAKQIKLHEMIEKQPVEDLQLYLENEALMATQSILSDDESKDLFGFDHTETDLLDMDNFTEGISDFSDIKMPDEITSEGLYDISKSFTANNPSHPNMPSYNNSRQLHLTAQQILSRSHPTKDPPQMISSNTVAGYQLDSQLLSGKTINTMVTPRIMATQSNVQLHHQPMKSMQPQVAASPQQRLTSEILASQQQQQQKKKKKLKAEEKLEQKKPVVLKTPTTFSTNQNATSLQTLSQFLTSKVISKPAGKLAAVPNQADHLSAGKRTVTFIPQHQNTGYQTPLQGPVQGRISLDKLFPKSTLGKPCETTGDKQHAYPASTISSAYHLLDIKGSHGNQIIVSKPPVSLTNLKSLNVIRKPIYSSSPPLQSFSLNQLMAVTRGKTPEQTEQSPSLQASFNLHGPSSSSVTSIQALMQLSGKPKAQKQNEKQLMMQQHRISGEQLVMQQRRISGEQTTKVVRIPKNFLQGKTSPLTENAKPVTFQNIALVRAQPPRRPVLNSTPQVITSAHMLNSINRPIVAPLKISLPRATGGIPSPIRLASPGQSPIRLVSPRIRLAAPLNPSTLPAANQTDKQS